MNELPQPPALIRIKSDFSQGIDTRNPLHAAAYLRAASHFLSDWPQEWDAETLALALVDDESPNKKEVKLWQAIEKNTSHLDDPHLESDSLISDLAESFIHFMEENSCPTRWKTVFFRRHENRTSKRLASVDPESPNS